MQDKMTIDAYCPSCGTTSTIKLAVPLLLSPGCLFPYFECTHCATTFRIEINFYEAIRLSVVHDVPD
jgi:hypothetical protein